LVAQVSTVECVICHLTHLETPAEKTTMDKDGVMVLGYDSKDWTYYRDLYKGVYSVICKKTHDSLFATKTSKAGV
jgi:hypothetical protein